MTVSLVTIAGVDLALGATGIALGDQPSLATIAPPGRLKGYVRHECAADQIVRRLRLAAPDLVVLEGYDPHPRGYLALVRAAELGGIVRTALTKVALPFIDVPPSQLKLFATGKGNSPKPDVVQAARNAGVDPRDDNQADAYWLWRIGHWLHGGPAGNGTITIDLRKALQP